MRRFRGRWPVFWVLPVLLCVPPARVCADEPAVLADGVAQTIELSADESVWRGQITVPPDARSLSVTVSSERDLDLYLRHGQPLTSDFAAHADVASRTDAPFESVRLTPDGETPLNPGTWHIAVVDPAPGEHGARFEVVASVDEVNTPTTRSPGDEEERGGGPQPIARPGSTITVTLGGDEQATSRMVRIPIRDGTGGFVIEATNPSKTDVDLYVRRGRPLDMGDDDADYFALSSAPRERLVVGGVRPLKRGIYYCELVLVDGGGPVRVTVSVRAFATEAGRGTWGEQLPPPLLLRRWTKGRVEAGLAGVRWYSVTVPKGTRSLHAVLLGASAPLDLVLARKTDGSIMRRALTARVNERIDHVFTTPPDSPRYFLLGVMNRNPYEEVVDYRIALSLDKPPSLPADFRWPPLLPLEGRKPTVRVAAATVELTVSGNAGGSATCVTPRGRLLTCRHVLMVDEAKSKIQREGVLVAFPKRLDLPPVQSFVARVTHEDAASDLALLEITSDIFGRPLARDLALPWVPLGDSADLELGDPLLVFGYPSEGSERSRTPVILTRGAVSGLESVRGRPRWIKTDAWIGLGHSGGSMVDAKLRLVGIPAATLGAGEVLGLAVPVAVVPEAWKALIRRGVPR